MIVDYEDYLQAGWYIFPLHPIIDGKCGCDIPECPAAGKHPVMANYQHITTWDEEQLSYLTDEHELTGRNQLLDGFGVNLAGKLFVIDVDARNGGVDSFKRLCDEIGTDLMDLCGFVVRTGSGNGSMHLYFIAPEPPISLVTTLAQYKGIDFKSSGFVVGCGSMHKSGERYEAIKGSPYEALQVPAALIDILKRQERLRTFEAGRAIDFDAAELTNVVQAINNPNVKDYERWIRVGMGIHEATGGDGYELWREWSSKSAAHDEKLMPMKWHSFGKGGSSVVTLGTLLMLARADGYSDPVTFESKEEFEIDEENVTSVASRESVNIKRPPGVVGEIAQWINSRSLFPREYLAAGAALIVVSNAAGLRYRVEGTNTALNQVIFGIASSSTGKEAVYQRLIDCHRCTGLVAAAHGSIKSEQEIIRNVLRHQASFYTIDEIGSILLKLNNAKKKGSTAYLEAVMSTVMSIFSKADGVLPVGGDLKDEIKERIQRDVSRAQKVLDESPSDKAEQKLTQLLEELAQVDGGILHPFLSMYGTAEPFTFAGAIDREMMVGGFMGRAIVLEEPDNAPRRKTPTNTELPARIKMLLSGLYSGGSSSGLGERIERQGDICYVQLDLSSQKALDDVYEYWHGIAQHEQDIGSGLEPIALRAWETTIKVAGTLGVAGGVVSLEHVRYAHALVYKSTMWKLDKAKAADGSEAKDTEVRSEGVLAAVRSTLDKNKELTAGVIRNRYRNQYTREQIDQALDWMVKEGIVKEEERKGGNGRTHKYYRLK